MSNTTSEIEIFIEYSFKKEAEASEIMIQSNKSIIYITASNEYRTLKKINPFNINDINKFSLSQNQIASKKNPSIGGILNNNIRWHLIAHPITINDYCIQFRKLNFSRFKLSSLLKTKTSHFLSHSIAMKKGCIFFGETFSGKSTLLHAMVNHYHELHRVIILEKFSEISSSNPLWTNLNCHQNPLSGGSSFDFEYLLKQTQRLRPDVIVIGEITSFQSDFFKQLMHSGFQKIFLTVHGSNLDDVTTKLQTSDKELLKSFLLFHTKRTREISCLNQKELEK